MKAIEHLNMFLEWMQGTLPVNLNLDHGIYGDNHKQLRVQIVGTNGTIYIQKVVDVEKTKNNEYRIEKAYNDAVNSILYNCFKEHMYSLVKNIESTQAVKKPKSIIRRKGLLDTIQELKRVADPYPGMYIKTPEVHYVFDDQHNPSKEVWKWTNEVLDKSEF